MATLVIIVTVAAMISGFYATVRLLYAAFTTPTGVKRLPSQLAADRYAFYTEMLQRHMLTVDMVDMDDKVAEKDYIIHSKSLSNHINRKEVAA